MNKTDNNFNENRLKPKLKLLQVLQVILIRCKGRWAGKNGFTFAGEPVKSLISGESLFGLEGAVSARARSGRAHVSPCSALMLPLSNTLKAVLFAGFLSICLKFFLEYPFAYEAPEISQVTAFICKYYFRINVAYSYSAINPRRHLISKVVATNIYLGDMHFLPLHPLQQSHFWTPIQQLADPRYATQKSLSNSTIFAERLI